MKAPAALSLLARAPQFPERRRRRRLRAEAAADHVQEGPIHHKAVEEVSVLP